jgi:hypothetical protein
MAFSNPLQWPANKVRTTKRRASPFGAMVSTIVDELERDIKKLGLEDVRITTNHPLRVDGSLSQVKTNIFDPGVAIYFKRKGEEVCIPFDRFNSFWGNVRAVGLYLQYMSRLENYDMAEIADQAFTSFKLLPASTIQTPLPHRDWWVVLGVPQDANAHEVKAVYRGLLKLYHPDAGGNQAEFDEVRRAYDEWRKL